MNIKSPFQNTGTKKSQPNALELVLGMSEKMQKLDEAISSANDTRKKLEEDNARRESEHVQMKNEHNNHVQTLIEAVTVVEHVHSNMMKGEPGKNADPVDTNAIIEKVKSSIRQPKDGETPVINEEKIAKLASKFIKVPEVKMPTFEPIDHQAIVDKVFEMLDTGKKKLSMKYIGDMSDGMEQYLRPIRSLAAGFRGGGDVIKAGSNITVTTDADGKKVITGSAGSGFTPLTATETPNGSTIVFTFSLAVAQPSFIISDGVWMEATAQDSTVNWTWNNGTKKATMTIPPNSGIKGIV